MATSGARKARELDEKFAISDLVGEGARVAGEAAKRGAETMANGAERLRTEAQKLTDDEEVGEAARRAATETVRGVKKAGEVFRDVAGDAGKKAGEVLTMQKTTTIALRNFTNQRELYSSFNRSNFRYAESEGLDQRESRQGGNRFSLAGSWY